MNALELINQILEAAGVDFDLQDTLETITGDGAEQLETFTVRLATQPSWPLAFEVRGVTSQSAIDDVALEEMGIDESDDDGPGYEKESEPILWITEGGSCDHPYAPRGAWQG